MRTTLNIEDKLVEKARSLTGIKEKTALVKQGEVLQFIYALRRKGLGYLDIHLLASSLLGKAAL